MSKTKTYLFSDFKYNKKSHSNNELTINELINTTIENGSLKTNIFYNDFLKNYFSTEIYNTITTNNSALINTTKQFIPFEYFDETAGNYITRMFLISSSNICYELNKTTYIFENKYTFNFSPEIIESNNEIYLFDNNKKCLLIDTNKVVSVEDLPKILSYETDENYLYFITSENPFKLYKTAKCSIKNLSTNLNQYQYISSTIETGQILKIVKINNKIFAVCQYAILKYNLTNDSFENICKINFEICKNTIQDFNDYIIFLTSNGLYSFDGNDFKFLSKQLFNKNAKSFNFNGNFYIFSTNSGNYLYTYNFNENANLKINFENIANIYKIKTYGVYNLCISYLNNNIYKNITLFGDTYQNNVNQKIIFNPILFGSDNSKIIKSIKANFSGNFTLKISTEKTSAYYIFQNNTEINNINLSGTIFNFSIESSSNFYINSLIISTEEIGE